MTNETLKPYVILVRHARFWLVGPFATMASAADWGRAIQSDRNDDPRWNTIYLADDQVRQAPMVFAPVDPAGVENGEPDVSRDEFERNLKQDA